jgi:hypothetical protein
MDEYFLDCPNKTMNHSLTEPCLSAAEAFAPPRMPLQLTSRQPLVSRKATAAPRVAPLSLSMKTAVISPDFRVAVSMAHECFGRRKYFSLWLNPASCVCYLQAIPFAEHVTSQAYHATQDSTLRFDSMHEIAVEKAKTIIEMHLVVRNKPGTSWTYVCVHTRVCMMLICTCE